MDHPATYSVELYPVMRAWLHGQPDVLDPFAGVGGIFDVAEGIVPSIYAIEIEPKWAAHDPRIQVGSALYLLYPDCSISTYCTSPTFGNRMADHHNAKDASKRITYRHMLGEELQPENSGQLQWGPEYRAFHVLAWREAWRVLTPGGLFILDIKDHIRKGERQHVPEWHHLTLKGLGFELRGFTYVKCPGMRRGQNYDKRLDDHVLLLYRKPEIGVGYTALSSTFS